MWAALQRDCRQTESLPNLRGNERRNRVKWLRSEVETMEKMYRKGDALMEIARVLGRTPKSVSEKLRRDGTCEIVRRWTPEEEALVLSGEALENRTKTAIKIKRCRMKKQLA